MLAVRGGQDLCFSRRKRLLRQPGLHPPQTICPPFKHGNAEECGTSGQKFGTHLFRNRAPRAAGFATPGGSR